MQTASKKVINSWAMYDWANSAYNLVITTTIFPAYYDAITTVKDASGKIISHKVLFLGREFESASLYNYSISFAYLVIALMSPILSSIADYRGNKKSFMRFFCYLGGFACCMLFLFNGNTLSLGIAGCILGAIGYCGSLVFYNSYLPEIAAEQGGREVSLAVLAATLTTAIVFFPVIFLYGVSRFLFVALAMALSVASGKAWCELPVRKVRVRRTHRKNSRYRSSSTPRQKTPA